MVLEVIDNAPPAVRREIELCGDCEADREPRAWLCEYHGGWWDGYEQALEQARSTP